MEAFSKVRAMVERRTSARVSVPYTVRLRGIDSGGQEFKEETQMDNLSIGGLYVQTTQRPEHGMSLSLSARLSVAPAGQDSAVRLAARGTVVRVVPQPEGTYGVAVQFTRRRIL